MVAKVATEYSAGRLFDYTVPAVFVSRIRVGQRVTVPFHNRLATGYVFELVDDGKRSAGAETQSGAARKDFKLKDIVAIEDEVPFFTPDLLRLANWMAGYLLEPLEKILKCILPSSVRKREVREKLQQYISAVPDADLAVLTSRQRELWENLRRTDGAWVRQAVKEFSCSEAILKALVEKGAAQIEKVQRRRDPLARRKLLPSKPMALMPEQAAALSQIVEMADDPSKRKPLLLYGVTGSGKTEVYLQAIADALERGQGAIVMVPEIALTAQTVQRFASRFGDRVAVLHSALGDGERFDEWHRIRSGRARVVVGPRSAVFAPVSNLGLIVVDEEHEPSYKQEDPPRYNGRDVAVMRAHIENCRVLLGSATPSMESWRNVITGKYACARLEQRVHNRPMPAVHVVDMRMESAETGKTPLFSRELMEAVQIRLDKGEQIILFLNRRGYAHSFSCPKCGYVASCDNCSLPYTYHRADNCLRCHVCGEWKHLPNACPECSDPSFRFSGFGTQRVEVALAKCFPSARILRMDADVTQRRHSHEDILSVFRAGGADILLGTQMIAKGLDFPNVTLVGVLMADISLNMPDFRASERSYQLLAQVAGRAGRAELPGEVYIQTFNPDHPAIKAASARGNPYEAFADRELAERSDGLYPPFSRLTCITFKCQSLSRLEAVCRSYERLLRSAAEGTSVRVGDILPAPLEKAKTYYQYQVLIFAPSIAASNRVLQHVFSSVRVPPDVRICIDVDALHF